MVLKSKKLPSSKNPLTGNTGLAKKFVWVFNNIFLGSLKTLLANLIIQFQEVQINEGIRDFIYSAIDMCHVFCNNQLQFFLYISGHFHYHLTNLQVPSDQEFQDRLQETYSYDVNLPKGTIFHLHPLIRISGFFISLYCVFLTGNRLPNSTKRTLIIVASQFGLDHQSVTLARGSAIRNNIIGMFRHVSFQSLFCQYICTGILSFIGTIQH